MKKTLISLAVMMMLTGCATSSAIREKLTGNQFDEPKVEQNSYLKQQSEDLRPPAGGPITVAVYGFKDLTGQRKSMPMVASLSSAVTQGADAYLIKALQDVGSARWFTVVERGGLENLIKERQMIRQMREQYQGRDAKQLPPLLFAGMIIEGGIVGYDSNTLTGGSGMRLFGIGAQTQYQSDTVTVNLRTVSVATGEVLTSITITKTVLSYMDKLGVLRFVSAGEQAIEAETGASINESINKATNMAIQAAVVATIKEGARKGHWAFREDRKDELVQSNPTPKAAPQATSQPAVRPADGEPKLQQPEQTKQDDASVPKAKKQVAKIKDWTNLRSGRDKTSEKIMVLKPDSEVEVISGSGQHLLIRVEGKEGWILKDSVKIQ